jgi:glutathione S-transferase
MQLEEKKIPYVVQKENMRCYGPKTREYLGLTPSGLLPALELDGRFLTESSAIMDLLERAFPDNKPLVPDAAEAPAAAARHAALLQLERRLFGDWLDWLVRGGGGGANFFSTLAVVEGALAAPAGSSESKSSCKPTEGPYFLGEDVSLCDLVFAPFLERIAASIPYYKGVRFFSIFRVSFSVFFIVRSFKSSRAIREPGKREPEGGAGARVEQRRQTPPKKERKRTRTLPFFFIHLLKLSL